MAFYGRHKLVDSFTYRKLRVEIYRASKGGFCEKCKLDHEPADRKCSSCGDDLTPTTVYLIKVSGKDAGIECASKEEADEFAKAWIDDYIDDPDKPDDEEEEEDDLIIPDKKKDGKNRRRRIENDAKGGGKVRPTLEAVRKLGWGKKALAILRERD